MRTPTETEFVNRMMIDPGTYTPAEAKRTYRYLNSINKRLVEILELKPIPTDQAYKYDENPETQTPLDNAYRVIQEALDEINEAHQLIENVLTQPRH